MIDLGLSFRHIVLGGVLAVALIGSVPGVTTEAPCLQCIEAETTNGWCDACNVGWVGGIKLRSGYLWEILDAHGHQLNIENLHCDGCTRASKTDDYCSESRIGFVNGEAYFSRLTWMLAKAERHQGPVPDCSECQKNMSRAGWCSQCEVGRVGSRVLHDRAEFDNLLHDLEILEIANSASFRCEHCAAAIVTDTQCPICRIHYVNGKPVDAPDNRTDD